MVVGLLVEYFVGILVVVFEIDRSCGCDDGDFYLLSFL
jgi:hypothetical protein